MRIKGMALAVVLLTASAAIAHQGVQNQAVQARMNNMMDISNQVKIMGEMARGKQEFDADIAKAAAAEIANHAALTVGLFEANETDPKSEAKPEIWENFEDFSAIALELETEATNASTSIETMEDLAIALRAIAATCSSCHKDYRK